LEGKPLTETIDRLICPAMQKSGELCTHRKSAYRRNIWATRTVGSAIYKLRSALPVPEMKNGLAVCCAMEGDLHELPTLLAQIASENEGLEVVNFGRRHAALSSGCRVVAAFSHFVCISEQR
jgi:methanogenic corrinoid protein MtbC1